MELLAAIWRLFWNLVRDVAPGGPARASDRDELAQDDDLLDATQDDDGMDASGL